MTNDIGKRFLRQTAVIPTHKDLFGCEATLGDLRDLLRKYPVAEWLSYLSRMQNLLVGTRAEQPECLRRVFDGMVSLDMCDRLREFEKQCSGRMLLYYERQMSTLQQLAVLHAPESGTAAFDNETGRHDLCIALLMTMDIMGADRPSDGTNGSLLSIILQDQIRMSQTLSEQYAARAFYFYELDKPQRSREVSEYLELFQIATGVSAVDCILGGLDIAAREETQAPEDIANAWHTIPHFAQGDNPKETTILDAYKAVRMKPLAELRELIKEWDDKLPVRDWNLIALSQAPICHLGDLGAFVLNHTALGRSLFDSVRHAILTAANRLPAPYDNKQAIGGLYGKIFESYIHSIFEHVYPGRVCRISEDKTGKRADFLVWFPDKVILVEVKSVHFVGKNHTSFLSIEGRREELKDVGMPRAIDQLESTVRALRVGDVRFDAGTEDVVVPSMPSYDWTITPVIPVIVTEEQMPQAPGCWDTFYSSLCGKLYELTAAGPLGKLRLLNVGDVERLPDLRAPDDLATILIRWGADPSLRDLTWNSLLATECVNSDGSFMLGRFIDMVKFLAGRLGLDENRFAIPARMQRDQ
jgi:hypothetical protein